MAFLVRPSLVVFASINRLRATGDRVAPRVTPTGLRILGLNGLLSLKLGGGARSREAAATAADFEAVLDFD